jgi:hypothetical protein
MKTWLPKGPQVRLRKKNFASLSYLEGEVLVVKLKTVDRLATRAIVPRKVASLAHELGDYPVKRGALHGKTRENQIM